MDTLIMLIVYIILFAIVGYGLLWVCRNFGLPAPVQWVVGGILLIIILLFLVNHLGTATGFPRLR